VKGLYFTGMLRGQSGFYIQYIDPDTHAARSYCPDFLFQENDGVYVIVEAKGIPVPKYCVERLQVIGYAKNP